MPKKVKKSASFYQFIRRFMKPLNMMVWPLRILNKQNFDAVEGALLICNHYTTVDATILTANLLKDDFNALAKSEAFKTKIGNWFLRKIGAIPVNRGEADIEAVKACLKVLKDNRKLLLFPEGTRNKAGTKEMAEFKPGTARFAIKTKKPIVPMIYFEPPKSFKRTYLYIGEPFLLEQFYSARTSAEFEEATEFIRTKMLETRALCDKSMAEKK